MKYRNTKSGFSLIELIIYISLFTLLSGVVIISFTSVVRSFADTRTNRDLQESGMTAMERMSREIRKANTVNIASVLNATPGTLELATTDSLGAVATVKFIYENNAINMYSNGVLSANLLGAYVLPTSLIFRKITTTNGTAVKIEMTLQDNRGKDHRTANYYDTVILRGAY